MQKSIGADSTGGKRALDAAEAGYSDKVTVEIWGYQYKAFKRAAEILVGLGADADNTPEHILRAFCLIDDADDIVDLFLSSVDIPEEQLAAMKAAWRKQRDRLTA